MKAVTVGGIEAVIKAINPHIHNSDVCENGCYALYNMIFNNGKNSNSCSFFVQKKKMSQLMQLKTR